MISDLVRSRDVLDEVIDTASVGADASADSLVSPASLASLDSLVESAGTHRG